MRHPSKLIRRVEAIAEGWDWPRPYTPKNCYYWLERGNEEVYAAAFYRGSYLAKERGKGHKKQHGKQLWQEQGSVLVD